MRAELLGQIVGAQFELERAIAELTPGSARVAGEQQVQGLKDLQRQIGSASPAMLSAMRAEITAAVSVAHATVQQGRAAATAAEAAAILAEAASASRQQVTALMQDMHRFDPYLHFASRNDEDAYRNREAERRAYIEAQQAKGTPQGDLNAGGGAVGQMVDAKAHGAGNSPEFAERWKALAATTANLRAEVQRTGGSTKEFDDRLREDLRTILKSKGVSDAEIEARLAAYPNNPLEAAKAYIQSDSDLQRLQQSTQDASEARATTTVASDRPVDGHVNSAIAKLRAAGVVAALQPPADNPDHGVTLSDSRVSTRAV